MKKSTFVLIALFLVLKISAQGIAFEHGTYAEALAKAKAEKKAVFMDCFTTWCGPCKVLAKDIFPQKIVGDYINEHFISIKIDMEKGEGIELAKKYDVKAFPTLLFLDSEGRIIHRSTGSSRAEDFVEQAKAAFDPSKQLSFLQKQYESGDRSLAFVARYVKALVTSYNIAEAKKVGSLALKTLKPEQFLTEEGFIILAYTGMEYKGKEYDYLLKHQKEIAANPKIGKESLDYVLAGTISAYLVKVAGEKSLEELNKAIQLAHQDYMLPMQDKYDIYFRSQYFLAHKDYKGWFAYNKKEADAVFEKDKSKAVGMYANMCYTTALDKNFTDSEVDASAIAMLEEKKDADPKQPVIIYCLAQLYAKAGNKQKAMENLDRYSSKCAEQGIDLHPKFGDLKNKIESL